MIQYTTLAYRSTTDTHYMACVMGDTGITVVTRSQIVSGCNASYAKVCDTYRSESSFGIVHSRDNQPTYSTRSTAEIYT